jgi:cytochrome c oxidase assembly protein subunit 11
MLNKPTDHRRLVVGLIAMALLMLGAAFASVPLYNIFCKVTGYGGTTQRAYNISSLKGSRKIKILFDSNIDPNLPWKFYPKQRHVNLIPGENVLAFYESENLSDQGIRGMAVYNVTPHKVGKYFHKIECFCFEEFILSSKQKVLMPVYFFIDPKIENDAQAQDIETITLSYTFFKLDG